MDSLKKKIWEFLPIHKGQVRSWLVMSGVIIGILGWNEINPYMSGIGGVLLIMGIYIQLICRGHIHQNEVLTTSGPYRWVRHPMHLSKFMIDLGICFFINVWALTAVYSIFWYIAHRKNRLKEENELIEIFGDEYREYIEKVPSWIPWKFPLPKEETSDTHFAWTCENLTTGRYMGRVFRYTSYPFLMIFASEIGTHGYFVFSRSDVGMLALAGFIMFYCSYKLLYSVIKYRQFPFPRWTFKPVVRGLFFVTIAGILMVLPHNVDPEPIAGSIPVAYSKWILLSLLILFLLPFVASFFENVSGCYRFWYFLELGGLLILCTAEGYPWLFAIPFLYYLPLILYETPDDTDIRFDRIFEISRDMPSRATLSLIYTGMLFIGFVMVAPGEFPLQSLLSSF